MICTVVVAEGQASVPLPHRAVQALGLRPGQFVRVEVRPLGSTPVLEPDGTPAY